ncbi:hypothetical protein EWI21_11835, partial [Enterococcus faecium]
LSQNVVHSDSDLILHNSSVLIDKEPIKKYRALFLCHKIFVKLFCYSKLAAFHNLISRTSHLQN